MDRASGNEVEISRQAKERRKEESACENGRAAQRLQPRRLTGRPVIYRAEPNPSLTPLLRNYTQSVANKSKKVSAALVLIHETSALVLCLASPRLASPLPSRSRAKLGSPPLSRSVRTFAANSIEILVQIARALAVRVREPRDRARSELHWSYIL